MFYDPTFRPATLAGQPKVSRSFFLFLLARSCHHFRFDEKTLWHPPRWWWKLSLNLINQNFFKQYVVVLRCATNRKVIKGSLLRRSLITKTLYLWFTGASEDLLRGKCEVFCLHQLHLAPQWLWCALNFFKAPFWGPYYLVYSIVMQTENRWEAAALKKKCAPF